MPSAFTHAAVGLALGTNGGLGIALFAPFSNARYSLPWHSVEVSPLSVSRFFSARGAT